MPLPSFDPADYGAQLAAKVARYKADFAAFGLPDPAVFESAPQAYRLRSGSWFASEGIPFEQVMLERFGDPVGRVGDGQGR